MNSDKREDYYVGLDMGTGSLGGAVTDTQYHLLKVKGKDFWFVREYETAKSQLDRRTHRIAKRRLQRHKARIGLIRSYFAEDVLKHDPLFYIRQDNSKYYQEDKDARLTTKDSLFADPGYGDKEYHDDKEYPTIFHLRQALLRDQIKDEERYSRFLYLAIINMFEHRGHFLLNTESSDLNADMIKDVGELVMNAICGVSEYGSVTYKEIIEILEDKNISRTAKKDQIASKVDIKKSEKAQMERIKCLCGMEADARVMFELEADEKIKIAFQQAAFEDEKEEIEVAIGEDRYLIIENMKQLYDYSQLQSVLNGFDYLSDARVQMYEKHKEDLHLLKKVYRKNLDREMYDRMFRSGEEGSYCAYSNSTNSVDSLAEAKKYRRNMKKRSQKDLYDRIKKDLKEVHDADADAIRKEMEEKGEQGRKNSREKRLLKLYESIRDERNWAAEIKNANASGKLNSKKMYLYYLQMGRDVYTGEPIDIEDLFDDSRYDIDHIYPRSLTNDNNIENNLVLVSKTINQNEKKNDYPVPEKVRTNKKVRDLWHTLHKMGFMNDEKYNRLTSTEHLTDDQLAGFIARQLVETAQGAKGIAELMKAMLPGTDIVYAKARNVSDFRKEYKMLKSRLVNDYHHAQDAYLNIVVGNVYFTKFTRNPVNFVKKEARRDGRNYDYNLYKMYSKDIIRNGEIAWIATSEQGPGTIRLVKETMGRNTPVITRQAFEQQGELFNLQPVGKYSAKKDNYVPLKINDEKVQDVSKYGGYTSLNPSYFIFIEHGPEKKRKKCFEVIQSYYSARIKTEKDLIDFLVQKGYKNPKVINAGIKKNALIKYNGYFLYIIGMDARKNIEFSNATAMCLKNNYIQYVCKLEKMNKAILLSEKQKTNLHWDERITCESNLELYRELTEKHLHSIYQKHPKSIGNCLAEGEGAFKLLDIEQQVKILCDIVQYTSFQRGVFSLKVLGGPKEVGRIRISGNMTEAKECKLINYSITGMYKTEMDLLKK